MQVLDGKIYLYIVMLDKCWLPFSKFTRFTGLWGVKNLVSPITTLNFLSINNLQKVLNDEDFYVPNF